MIITAPRDDFKAFVVASNCIMSVLFCENRSCCSKLWKKYADGAILSLAFFFSCRGGNSATECHKVTRESIGQKSSVAVTCFYRRGRVNMDIVPAARRGHIVTHPLPSCPIHQLHSVWHSFVYTSESSRTVCGHWLEWLELHMWFWTERRRLIFVLRIGIPTFTKQITVRRLKMMTQ